MEEISQEVLNRSLKNRSPMNKRVGLELRSFRLLPEARFNVGRWQRRLGDCKESRHVLISSEIRQECVLICPGSIFSQVGDNHLDTEGM